MRLRRVLRQAIPFASTPISLRPLTVGLHTAPSARASRALPRDSGELPVERFLRIEQLRERERWGKKTEKPAAAAA